MQRLTISLNEISYVAPCGPALLLAWDGLVALVFHAFLLRCPFWASVARASLVVARRVRRTDEGGNRNARLCRCSVEIDFDISTWFPARSGKAETMKAVNVMRVFELGWCLWT